MSKRKWQLLSVVLVVAFFALSGVIQAQIQSHFQARDPGVRGGAAGAGGPIAGLNGDETEMFNVGLDDFSSTNNSSVGVYVDDVFLASFAEMDFNFYDLERIEVTDDGNGIPDGWTPTLTGGATGAPSLSGVVASLRVPTSE